MSLANLLHSLAHQLNCSYLQSSYSVGLEYFQSVPKLHKDSSFHLLERHAQLAAFSALLSSAQAIDSSIWALFSSYHSLTDRFVRWPPVRSYKIQWLVSFPLRSELLGQISFSCHPLSSKLIVFDYKVHAWLAPSRTVHRLLCISLGLSACLVLNLDSKAHFRW